MIHVIMFWNPRHQQAVGEEKKSSIFNSLPPVKLLLLKVPSLRLDPKRTSRGTEFRLSHL